MIDAAKFLKKKTGGPNQTQSKVFAIFLSLDQTFSWKLHRMIACNNASHLVEEKFAKKNWGPKIGSENKFFTIFSSLVHNVVGFLSSIFSNLHVFHVIEQDCSLGQCPTSSRAETSRKTFFPQMTA